VEACNSCGRTLIFSSPCLLMLVFFSFYSPFVTFSMFQFFIGLFPFFLPGFLLPFVPPPLFFFTFDFVSVFWLLWVPSLAYPNLLGTKRLVSVVGRQLVFLSIYFRHLRTGKSHFSFETFKITSSITISQNV
jgi:hypothetical protein